MQLLKDIWNLVKAHLQILKTIFGYVKSFFGAIESAIEVAMNVEISDFKHLFVSPAEVAAITPVEGSTPEVAPEAPVTPQEVTPAQ
jgi:hypothetical protein